MTKYATKDTNKERHKDRKRERRTGTNGMNGMKGLNGMNGMNGMNEMSERMNERSQQSRSATARAVTEEAATMQQQQDELPLKKRICRDARSLPYWQLARQSGWWSEVVTFMVKGTRGRFAPSVLKCGDEAK